MKKTIIALSVAFAVALVAVLTCPDKEAHKQALMGEINTALSETLMGEAGESDLEQGIALFGGSVTSILVGTILDTTLKTNNYFVLSIGKITIGDNSKVVSTGIFGHVFTHFNSDDLKEAAEKSTEQN